MMMDRKAFETALSVNGKGLDLNPFIADYIARVTAGIVASLKGTENPGRVEILIDGPVGMVTVKVNGRNVPTDSFANDVIAATIRGMVSVLKGGSNIENLAISIRFRNA